MKANRFVWYAGDYDIVSAPRTDDYNPDEPRAPDGKWGEGGAKASEGDASLSASDLVAKYGREPLDGPPLDHLMDQIGVHAAMAVARAHDKALHFHPTAPSTRSSHEQAPAEIDEASAKKLLTSGAGGHPDIGAEKLESDSKVRQGTVTKYVSDHGDSRYVLKQKGVPVAVLHVKSKDGKTATISTVYTDPAHRRNGLAGVLLARAEKDFTKVNHAPKEEQTPDGRAWAGGVHANKRTDDFNPDEPRAQDGKWGEGGSGAAQAPTGGTASKGETKTATPPKGEKGAAADKPKADPKAEAKGEKPAADKHGATPEEWAKANQRANTEVFSAAQEYLRQAKLPALHAMSQQNLSLEEGRSIANSYDAAHSDPENKDTVTAYHAFNKELAAQRVVAEKAGYKFEPWSKDGQPYANSKEMMKDVRDNKHLYYFKSTEGTTPNKLMSLTENDTFRAVHDLFGHAMAGNQFGPKGETNAFLDHVQMFSPDARKALATETVGQNAWFNFSKANEGKPIGERKFADQKAFLLDPKLYQPLIDRSMKHDAADEAEDDLYFTCPCHRRAVAKRGDAFDPGEARDENGKWSGGGAGGTAPHAASPHTHGGGAQELSEKANANGGFTFDPHHGAYPTSGYAVSMHPGHEEVIRSKELSPEAVKGYLDRHGGYIKAHPGAHVGGWYDPEAGKWYLDVSHVTHDPHEAETLAKQHNQEAYYDLGKHESVYVKSGKERRLDERQAQGTTRRRTKNLLRPRKDVPRGDRGGDEEARGAGTRASGNPPEARVDYSPDEPRAADGEWGEGGGRAAASTHVEHAKTSSVRSREHAAKAETEADRAKASKGKDQAQHVEQAHDHAREAERHAREANAAAGQAKEAAGDDSPSAKEASKHAAEAGDHATAARAQATGAQKAAAPGKAAGAARGAADKATRLADKLHAAAAEHPTKAGAVAAEADDHAKAAREHARAAATAKTPEDAAQHTAKAHEHAAAAEEAVAKLTRQAAKHAQHETHAGGAKRGEAASAHKHVAQSWQALLKLIMGE